MPNASTSTKCEGEIAKRLGSYSMYPVEFRVALGKERGKRLRQADYAVRVTVARCNTCGVELKPKTNSQGFYPNSLDRHSKSNRCRSRSSLSSNASSCSSSTDHSSANPADLSKLHGSRAVHGWFECSCCGTYCLNKEDARDHFTRRCTGEGGEWVDKSNVTSELTRSSHAAKLSSIAWEVMRGAEPITSPEVQSVDEASESLSDSGSTDEGMQSVSQAHSPPSSYQPCDDAASIPDSPLLFDADEIPKCFSVGNEVLVTPSFADGLNDAVNLNESCMDFGQPLKRIRSNSNDEDDFQLASELGLVEESDAFSNDEFSFYLNRLQQEHSVNSSSTTNTDHLGYLCSTHYDGAEVELGSEISMQFHVPGVLWDESLTLVNTGSVQDGIQYVEESVSITQSESRTPQCTVQLRAKVSGRANDDLYGYWRLARRSTNQEEVLHVGPMLWVHLVAVEQSQPAARVEVENEVEHGNSNHNFAPCRDASVPEDTSGEESTSLGPESGGLTATNPQQSVSLREVQQPNFEAMLLEVSQPGEAVESLESTLVQLNDAQRDDSYELDTELMQPALLPLGQDLAQTVRLSVYNDQVQAVGASVQPSSDQSQRGVDVSVQQTILSDQVRHADDSVQNDQQQSVLSNQQEPINASVQELLQKDQKQQVCVQQVSQTCTQDNGKQFAHNEQERHVGVFSHPTSLDQVQNVAETVQHAGHYSTHSDQEEQTGLPLQSTSLNKQQRVDVSALQSVHKDLCDSGNASVLQLCSLDQERQVAHGGSEQRVDVSALQSVQNNLCGSGNASVLQPCSLDQERQVAHGGSDQQVDVSVQQSVQNNLCGSGNATVQHFGSENEITLVSPDQVREQVTLWLKGNDSCILGLVNVESRKHATVVQEALRGFTHLQVPCGNSNSLENMQQCVCSWRNQFCEVLPVEFAQLCAEQNYCASTNVKKLLLQSLKEPLIGLEQSCQMAIDPVMFVLDLQDKKHLSSDLVRNLIGVFAAVETPQWLKLLVVTDGEFVPNMMNVVQGANLAIKVIQVDELESALLTKVQAVSDQWIQAATDPNDASVGLPQAGFTTHLLLYLLFLIQLLQLVGQNLRSPRKAIHHVLFGSCQVLMTALKTLVNVHQRGNLLSVERLAVLMASVKQIVHAARNVQRNRDDQSNHFVDTIGPSGKERDRNMKHNQITQNTKKTQYYHSSECVSQGILVATHSSGCKPEILLSLRQAVTHCVQQQLKTTVSLQAIQKLSSAIGVSVQQCETVLMSLINGAFVDADTWSSKTQALLLRAAEPSLSFWQLSAWFSSADENPQSSSVFDENAARFWEQVSQLLADATVCSFPQDIDAAQCRSIWWFQLHPLIRTEKWSNEEQDRLWRMVRALNPSCGDRSVQVEQLAISTWAKVSKQLPGRTPEQVRAKAIASIGKARDSNSSIFAE